MSGAMMVSGFVLGMAVSILGLVWLASIRENRRMDIVLSGLDDMDCGNGKELKDDNT